MATTVELCYAVVFGKGDASESTPYEIELKGDDEKAYLSAKKLRLPFEDVPELEAVLERSYKNAENMAIDSLLEFDDEYVKKCLGKNPVNPKTINDLVSNRDPHTLAFFELTDLSDEELEKWDASDLDILPNVCDFDEGFEPRSPFDGGYRISVGFAENPEDEDLEEDEARETLTELLSSAGGDYTEVEDYIDRCDWLYDGDDLQDLANEIAESLGLKDYPDNEV